MVEKIGVSINDGTVVDEIEDPLEYGDKRSHRVEGLLKIALEAETVMRDEGVWNQFVGGDQRIVDREAVRDYLQK